MSVLTKLFVVLLVIVSLLLTAATVVFVNRAEPWKKWAEERESTINRKVAEIASLKTELSAAQTQTQQAIASGTSRSNELQGAINTLNGQIVELKNQKIAVDAEKAQLAATLTVAQSGVEAALKNVADIEARYKEAVKVADENRVKFTEQIAANTELQKQLDASNRELRYWIEQASQIKREVEILRQVVINNKLTLDAPKRRSAPDVKGVVKAVKVQDGMAYATISLGVADKIEKGMKFTVIDGQDFLGYLHVDTVEQNEAFGRLEGPRVQDVKTGNEVRTQIQPF